jgi:ribosomal protein L17
MPPTGRHRERITMHEHTNHRTELNALLDRIEARHAAHDAGYTPCPYCGRPTFESYSVRLAEIGGNGYQRRHVDAYRVGDNAPLGAIECAPGQLGWGAR